MLAHTDQQRMLADAARQFAQQEHAPARLRACRDRHPDSDRRVWEKIAELGWLGMLVPEDAGGLGAGFADTAQLVYEWGRACAPEPLVASGVLAARTLVHGEGPARARLLEGLIAGSLIPALAAQEGDALDPAPPASRAQRCAAGYALSGSKRLAVPAHADGFIVSARTDADTMLFWVPRDAQGLNIAFERRADGSYAARLALEGVEVADNEVVASAVTARRALARALDEALVLTAVEMSGMMRAMLELTLEYLRTRVQFGKPIGSFQALQHRAVDLFIAEQLARDVAQAACATLDAAAGEIDRTLAASRSKARAGESLDRLAREALQLHGAIGFTDEYPLGLYVNRALVLSAWLGNAAAHRRRFARLAPDLEVLSA